MLLAVMHRIFLFLLSVLAMLEMSEGNDMAMRHECRYVAKESHSRP